MNEQVDKVFKFEKNLENNIPTYEMLIAIYHYLNSHNNERIILDFSNITFVSANLLAVLGCCVDNTIEQRKHRVAVRNVHPKIKGVMRRNGFNRYFSWEDLDDTHHSTMRYSIFEATTKHLEDFERYLTINIFSRDNLPLMNDTYKNAIIDNLLEMFNNVIDHAESTSVYVCGQFFPKSSTLCFSIVDLGKTIHENVSEYMKNKVQDIPVNTLQWAIVAGNSTKSTFAPGGLGFSTLLDFVKFNKGAFTLISGNEIYEIRKDKQRFSELKTVFPGTIVTITINLEDKQLYFLSSENNSLIVF